MKEKIILMVEDNPDDAELTMRAFRNNNIDTDVFIARDGVEALDFLFKHEDEGFLKKDITPGVALILLDLKLPRVDGLEVLKQVRSHEKTRHIPVVILTSSVEERDLRESYRLGANSYIRKPVDFKRSNKVVGLLSTYWLEVNESPVN